MRIVYTFCGDLSGRPGGRLHYLAILRELAAQGHEMLALVPKYGWRKSELVVEGNHIRRVRLLLPSVRFANLLFQLLMVLLLPGILFWFRPDVLLIRGTVGFWWLAAILGRMLGLRVVAEINGVPWSEFRSRGKGWFPTFLAKISTVALCRAAHTIIAVTPGIGRELLSCLGPHRLEDIVVVQNGADRNVTPPEKRRQIRESRGFTDEDFVVGYACSMDFWHSVEVLVRGYEALPEEIRHRVHLVIFGHYVLPDLPLPIREHIHVTGHITPAEVREQMTALDVAVLLSDCRIVSRHGFSSLKFWEYLAAGLPVIVQEDDNLSPIVRRYFSAFSLPKPTAEAFSQAILSCWNRRKELPAMGQNNREQFERRFTWTHAARWVSWALTRDETWIRDFEPDHPCGLLETFPKTDAAR